MSKIFKSLLPKGKPTVKQLPIAELPITLYPVSPFPEEVTTIVADYEVNILS